MFRNYKEFLRDYVDFYKISLFNADVVPAEGHPGYVKHTNSNKISSESSSGVNNGETLKMTIGGAIEPYKKVFEKNLMNLNEYFTGGIKREDEFSPAIGSTLIEGDGRQITIGSFNKLDYSDLVYVLIILASLTLFKRYLNVLLRRSKIIKSLGLRPKDRKRLDECIWRLIFYTFSSTWLVYSCFVKHNSLFLFSGDQAFKGYSFQVDLDEYIICLIETSFYLHATYALVFEDVWRRDSPMMLVHHIAAIFSVASVYATRTHRIGLAIVVLRDTCDVLLEVTKLALCLHIQHGKKIRSIELGTKLFLWIFAMSFVINQLYYYPLFCLYHAMNLIKVYKLRSPTTIGMVTCCLIFLLLDLAWFLLILRLLYRLMFCEDPMRDLREYECDEDEITKNKDGTVSREFFDCKRKSD